MERRSCWQDRQEVSFIYFYSFFLFYLPISKTKNETEHQLKIAGNADRIGEKARFDSPYYLSIIGDKLVCADYGNHTIQLISMGKVK